jgi:uncharacterized protein
VVRTGQVVKVSVLEVDLARKRVSLTMKLDAPVQSPRDKVDNSFRPAGRGERAAPPRASSRAPEPAAGGAMAAAFAKLQGKR